MELFGNTNETLDLWYSTSDASDSTFDSTKYLPRNCTVTEGWVEIVSGIENTGSYKWSLNGVPITDYLRIKIIESKASPACDINGYYVKIVSPGRSTVRAKIVSNVIQLNSRNR